MAGCNEILTRRPRARGDCSALDREHTKEAMLPWKSHRPPLGDHVNFQADMATFQLSTMGKSPHGGRARARGARGGHDREHTQEDMLLGIPIGHRYGITLVSRPTWRLSIVDDNEILTLGLRARAPPSQ